MNPVPELVDLPDPAIKPMAHPLDVPDARRSYAISTLIEELTGPLAVLVLGLAVWSIAHPPTIGLLAAAVVAGTGFAATRWYRREAWAYIPRKRQDKTRAMPAHWALARIALRASTVTAATWLGARVVDDSGASIAVKATVFGALAGVAIDLALTYTWKLAWRTKHRDAPLGEILLGLVAAAGTAAGAVPAARLLLDGESIFGPHAAEIGGGLTCVVGATAAFWYARVTNDDDKPQA